MLGLALLSILTARQGFAPVQLEFEKSQFALNSPAHAGRVLSLSFQKRGSGSAILVSASRDKTLREWSVTSNGLKHTRVIRYSIGFGEEGALEQAAVASDGRYLLGLGREPKGENVALPLAFRVGKLPTGDKSTKDLVLEGSALSYGEGDSQLQATAGAVAAQADVACVTKPRGNFVSLITSAGQKLEDLTFSGANWDTSSQFAISDDGNQVAAIYKDDDNGLFKLAIMDRPSHKAQTSDLTGAAFAVVARGTSFYALTQQAGHGALAMFENGKLRWTAPLTVAGESVAINANGTQAAIGFSGKEHGGVELVDLPSGNVRWTNPESTGFFGPTTAVAIAPDGTVAAGSFTGEIQCFSAQGRPLSGDGTADLKISDAIGWLSPTHLVCAREGKVFAGFDVSGTRLLTETELAAAKAPAMTTCEPVPWGTKSYEAHPLKSANLGDGAWVFSKISNSSPTLVCNYGDGKIKVTELWGANSPAYAFALSPDAKYLAVANLDGYVRIYDNQDPLLREHSERFGDHIKPLLTLALFQKSGDWVAWSDQTKQFYGYASAQDKFGYQIQEGNSVTFVPATQVQQLQSKEGLAEAAKGAAGNTSPARQQAEVEIAQVPAIDGLGIVDVLGSDQKRSLEASETEPNVYKADGGVAYVKVEFDPKALKGFDIKHPLDHIKLNLQSKDGQVLSDNSLILKVTLRNGINRLQVTYQQEPGKVSGGIPLAIKFDDPKADPSTSVFILGISNYTDKAFGSLPGDKDADQVEQYFKSQWSTVTRVPASRTTRQEILAQLDKFLASAPPSDDLVFYVSSHGVPVNVAGDGGKKATEGVMVTSDFVNPKAGAAYTSEANNGILWSELLTKIKGKIDGGNRRVALVLDTCYSGLATVVLSGGLGDDKNTITRGQMVHAGVTFSVNASNANIAFLSSSRAGEQSYVEDGKGSVFTNYLLQVLQDMQLKGNVALSDVYSDVAKKVHSQFPQQTPYFYAGPPTASADSILLAKKKGPP